MTNLDSVLKSRDISLLTKVHIVKAMIFPVVMYGCERWAKKRKSVTASTFSTSICGEMMGPDAMILDF